MKQKDFDLEKYLVTGIKNNLGSMIKAAAFDPAQRSFMLGFSAEIKHALARREKYEEAGRHIPTFLISSITGACNLHCAGCYARSLDAVKDGVPSEQMSAEKWDSVFSQAGELGISFIILAGGEPMVRRDVLERAASHKGIMFPVFTNGTMLKEKDIDLFAQNRNLIPVFSVEGGRESTDARRGKGIYEKVMGAAGALNEKKTAFGASVTVTSANLDEVTSDKFAEELKERGFKALIFVEYVPTAHETGELAPNDEQRERLAQRVDALRKKHTDMFIVSFPGDEAASGGCLAAGRGFFHINSHGGAEPCPFSPYSDVSLKSATLLEALDSGLFTALRSGDMLTGEHDGGCILFEKRAAVEKLLSVR